MNSNNQLNCEHYLKKCSQFTYSCCDSISACNRCHREISFCQESNLVVNTITCNSCQLTQVPSNQCINNDCNVQFSTSYCSICYIWTDEVITHCDQCRLCRVGTEGSLYHCPTCDICFKSESAQLHKCAVFKLSENDCPVCLESLHNTREPVVISSCGHPIHINCYRMTIRNGTAKCVLCRREISS